MICSVPSILLLSQSAHTGGGMEVWMADIAAALEKRGWGVTVALAEGLRFHDPERYIAEYPFGNVIGIDGKSGYRECRILNVLNILRKTEPDVAIPVGLADALYATALYKKMGGQCRLVACVHGQNMNIIDDLDLCKGYIDRAVSVSRKGCQTIRDRVPDLGERVIHHDWLANEGREPSRRPVL